MEDSSSSSPSSSSNVVVVENKSQRIAQREERVRSRMMNKSEQGSTNGCSVREEDTKTSSSLGQQQIADSLTMIERLKHSGTDEVTRVRAEMDQRESRRRIEEENRRNERLVSLRNEAVFSIEKGESLDRKWDDLSDVHMPQQLQTLIDEQRERCMEILKSKDELIKQFKLELKIKDEEYIKMLKREAEDVDTLLRRMGSQTSALKERYEEELKRIESSHLKERAKMLERGKEKISELFETRRKMELKYMDEKEKREKEYLSEISSMRVKDSEEYQKLKIKLETDIHILEQQLQEMRATYQLNSEKLEYNYRVLMERDMENRSALKQHGRRLARLREQLANLSHRFKKSEETFKEENKVLTEEYTRATEHYKDLQRKIRHFQDADTKKYKEVWVRYVLSLSLSLSLCIYI
jgi:dynein regulatry complex protein 1